MAGVTRWCRSIPRHQSGARRRRSLAAIFTSSGSESAIIFCITLPRWAFTVISLMPSSPPTCLFNRPETTRSTALGYDKRTGGGSAPCVLLATHREPHEGQGAGEVPCEPARYRAHESLEVARQRP